MWHSNYEVWIQPQLYEYVQQKKLQLHWISFLKFCCPFKSFFLFVYFLNCNILHVMKSKVTMEQIIFPQESILYNMTQSSKIFILYIFLKCLFGSFNFFLLVFNFNVSYLKIILYWLKIIISCIPVYICYSNIHFYLVWHPAHHVGPVWTCGSNAWVTSQRGSRKTFILRARTEPSWFRGENVGG